MHRRVCLIVLIFSLLLLAACGDSTECLDADCTGETRSCQAEACLPRCGVANLIARTTYDDYEAATFSFRRATVKDDGVVRNNWDLLFGNDRESDVDLFTVNMVTDDESFIVDLGDQLSICDVPGRVELTSFPSGHFGDHDYIPVKRDHLYFIRNKDSETRQIALIQVIEHELNRSVRLRWYLSPAADRFVAPLSCGQ